MDYCTPGLPVHHQLPELAQTHVHRVSDGLSNHLILCHPLFLLLSNFPNIRVFSNESVLCIRWPKYWSFIFSISPSNEYSGLISFQFSYSVVSDSLRPHGQQHSGPPCPSPTPRVYPNSCPLSQWCHPTISSSSPSALNLSQHQGLFKWVSSSHQVAKGLEIQFQHESFQFRVDFL